MIRPQRYFAWRVARELFFSNLVITGIILAMAGFSLRIYIYEHFTSLNLAPEVLAGFDRHLTKDLFAVFAIALVLIAITSIRAAQPLGRLIQRARELRRLDSPPGEADDEPIRDVGEWSDLERALNRIHKDLRGKTDALSREREELSTLIGAVSDAIFAIDRFEQPLFFNAQFAAFFRNEAQASLSAIFRVPEVLEGYRAVLASGRSQLVSASLHTANHLLPRHFSISLAPLRARENDANKINGAIGIFHDVTELKQSEQIRIEFVGNASHELRTPLTSIKGYVDTLRDDLKNQRLDDAPHFVDVISRNVDRLIFLVNDLLDLSALESGAELSKIPVSTSEVTEAALRQIESKRANKRQEIHVRTEAETVNAEPQRLEQVLVNLVHNAIKYIPEGSRIDVIWQRAESGGIVLRVKDNGPGIPLEHQARLFERFYRVDTGRSREQGGTGLGLSIVKHILLKHGGSVQLKSKPGAGAEFICYFP